MPTTQKKRLRVEDSMTDEDIRSSDIWFSDGNVVIMVIEASTLELVRRRRLYKVHKSIMSMHSPVWRDMFELPQSNAATGGDYYDGVPLVILPDDARDVDDLLSKIYKLSELQIKRMDPNTIGKVSGILKLAAKYQIESLRKNIVSALENDWPSTLEQWDSNEAHIKILMEGMDIGDVNGLYPKPGDAIRLARQFDIDSILPAAFYHVSRTFWLTDGFSSCGRMTIAEGMSTDPDPLTKTDIMAIFHGREAIRTEIMLFFRRLKSTDEPVGSFGLHFEHGGRNSPVTDCEKAFSDWRSMAHDVFFTLPPDQDHPLQLHDPLNTLQDLYLNMERESFKKDGGQSSNSFCTACRKTICQIIREERELIWDNLSDYFDAD